jgi:predicted ABC-class ATPase
MRQPAVDDVNRIYGFKGIKKAEELLGNYTKQKEYAILYIRFLRSQLNSWEEAVDAYNQGLYNVQTKRQNPNKDYVRKVFLVINKNK